MTHPYQDPDPAVRLRALRASLTAKAQQHRTVDSQGRPTDDEERLFEYDEHGRFVGEVPAAGTGPARR